MSDNTDAGTTYSDDGPNSAPADSFSYDLGAGPTSSALDGEARFSARITEADGSGHDVTISVYQLQNGETFVRLPHGYKVSQLTIGQMVGDGYANIWTDSGSTSTVVCFVAGCGIATPDGPRPVEELRVGDLVETLDNGPQPIRWHHRWRVRVGARTAPVRIGAGALGPGVPRRDLLVSPQHRIMVRSAIAARMFGVPEVLVAAKKLTGLPGVAQDGGASHVTYAHFMCARHEIVFANGAPAETLYPGPEARKVLAGLLDGVPQATGTGAPVRALTCGRKAQRLAERHARNGKPLVAACGL